MSISAADVIELRREGQALNLDHADTTLTSTAEVLAYTHHSLRALGFTEVEAVDQIELLVRALDLARETICEARQTLRALRYAPVLLRRLTKLARLAEDRKRPSSAAVILNSGAHEVDMAVDPPRDHVDHGALAYWQAPRRKGKRP